eukprot:115983_1
MGCWVSDDSAKDTNIPNKPLLSDDMKADTFSTQIVTENAPLMKEGYLFKKISDNQTHKTWTILKGHFLYFYKDKNSKTQESDKVDLFIFNKIQMLKNNKNKNTFQFELLSHNANKIFIAESYNDMLNWIDNIKKFQSIKIGFLKRNSSESVWCVLLKDCLLCLKDATHKSEQDKIFNLSQYNNILPTNPLHKPG